jgi:hypothetical protein
MLRCLFTVAFQNIKLFYCEIEILNTSIKQTLELLVIKEIKLSVSLDLNEY